MFDCHYDLLTYIYINRYNLKKVKKHLSKIFKDNITGGIFNLFYMSPDEMKKELGISKEEINIVDNLKEVNNLIKKENLIPKSIIYTYGIEGLDYLRKIEDIDEIYNLGVRSTNIVWNNDNKFGGGVKGNKHKGLTPLGEQLVKKLVYKNIAIDLSHSNEKTFWDITTLCVKLKEQGLKPKVFVSHSNCKSLCNNLRNITDKQIKKIEELNGIIGIVGIKPFCINERKFNNKKNKYENAYIEQIEYLRNLLNGVENIAVSTDDMTYYKENKRYYKNFNIFKQKEVKIKLETLLLNNKFSAMEIKKILYLNAIQWLKQ